MSKDLKLLQSEEGLNYGTFNDIVIENRDMLLIGTGDFSEYLTSQISGTKRIFITGRNYVSRSLEVRLDGTLQNKDINYMETSPNTFTFTIGYTPTVGQIMKVDYTFDNADEKIAQEIVKIFLTLRGTNFLAPNYGTNIPNLINIRKISTLSKDVRDQIVYALTYVKKINENEDVNIDKVLDSEVENGTNYFKITLKIQLTNGKLVVITHDFAKPRG